MARECYPVYPVSLSARHLRRVCGYSRPNAADIRDNNGNSGIFALIRLRGEHIHARIHSKVARLIYCSRASIHRRLGFSNFFSKLK